MDLVLCKILEDGLEGWRDAFVRAAILSFHTHTYLLPPIHPSVYSPLIHLHPPVHPPHIHRRPVAIPFHRPQPYTSTFIHFYPPTSHPPTSRAAIPSYHPHHTHPPVHPPSSTFIHPPHFHRRPKRQFLPTLPTHIHPLPHSSIRPSTSHLPSSTSHPPIHSPHIHRRPVRQFRRPAIPVPSVVIPEGRHVRASPFRSLGVVRIRGVIGVEFPLVGVIRGHRLTAFPPADVPGAVWRGRWGG